MFAEAGAWFWTMVVASIAIVIGDYNGTLEPALNKFEESIGIRTTLPEDTTIDAPYYIPPISEEVDSTWILPDSLKRNNDE
tara:strand:+ start:298 stop:540 length:243 start_codon:yes stop_codon:yes gene_type:complete